MRDRLLAWLKLRIKIDGNGCWVWRCSLSVTGYPKGRALNGVYHDAHVISWICHNGEVPDGLECHHKCKNRACVNPDHIELVTHQENCRIDFAKTHCPNGHEYVEGSYYTFKTPTGHLTKACKQCAKARAMAHYLVNRESHKAAMRANYLANRDARLAQMKTRYHRMKSLRN